MLNQWHHCGSCPVCWTRAIHDLPWHSSRTTNRMLLAARATARRLLKPSIGRRRF